MNYDAIVIGAGLNGLVTAAFLARAGRRVLVVERRASVGGSTSTEEFAPGFRADGCRHDAGWIAPSLVRDLDLERHGLSFLPADGRIVAPSRDGVLLAFGESGPIAGSLRHHSPRDAAKFPVFAAHVAALTGFLERLYAAPVPSPDASSWADLRTALRLGLGFRSLGRREMIGLLRVLPMSVAELLDDEFESPVLKGALGTRGVLHLCQGPRAAATAFNFLHHQVGRHAGTIGGAAVPRGGVGALADAVAASARAAGAEVRLGAAVARVLVRGGRAAGIALDSGEEIAAQRVVSDASPRATFLELCDPSRLAPEFVRAVRNIRYRGAWARVNLALDRLPAIGAAPGDAADGAARVRGIVIAPDLDYLERAYDDAKYGRVSAHPWLDARIPTVADPSLAPEGRHVMTVHVQYAPYARRDAAWNATTRDALGDLVVATLARHVPGIAETILHRQVRTPADLEHEYALPEGHAYDGEMMLDQVLFMRPVPACSQYGSPVPGLYVCGSGAHPGGAIAGGPGVNAARAVLQSHD